MFAAGPPYRILGIDPGLSRCGYACIEQGSGRALKLIAIGVITTPPTNPLPQRLGELRLELTKLMDELEPGVVAVEKVFFQVNVRTAMGVGQASGLALAEAAIRGCVVAEYTPNEVKSAVAGWGGADKRQVAQMVQARLGLAQAPHPADAADAAAIALCHLAHAPSRARVAQALARLA